VVPVALGTAAAGTATLASAQDHVHPTTGLVKTTDTSLLVPSQTSNSGKYLTTNGTTASWASVVTDPNPSIFMLGGM
jgi:hypothetical protein